MQGGTRVDFETTTPVTYRALLQGDEAIGRQTIFGHLFLPAQAAPPYAAVVLSIGSLGFESGREALYSKALNDVGIAAFVVDSFGPRGFAETASDQGRISNAGTASDALHAVRLLRGDNRFDPQRIGILGYSRGGQVTVTVYDRRLQAAMLGDDTAIRAHVGIYPSMNPQWHNPQPTRAPLLMLLGGADDRAPEAKSRDYAARLTAAGGTVTVKTIPNAHHSFDSLKPAEWAPAANLSKCRVLIDDDGGIYEATTGTRVEESWGAFLAKLDGTCGARGGTTGHGPNPRDIVVKDVQDFFVAALRG